MGGCLYRVALYICIVKGAKGKIIVYAGGVGWVEVLCGIAFGCRCG